MTKPEPRIIIRKSMNVAYNLLNRKIDVFGE